MHVFAPRTKSTKKPDQTGSFEPGFCQTGFSSPYGRPPIIQGCKIALPKLGTLFKLPWNEENQEKKQAMREGWVSPCVLHSHWLAVFCHADFGCPCAEFLHFSACINVKHEAK